MGGAAPQRVFWSQNGPEWTARSYKNATSTVGAGSDARSGVARLHDPVLARLGQIGGIPRRKCSFSGGENWTKLNTFQNSRGGKLPPSDAWRCESRMTSQPELVRLVVKIRSSGIPDMRMSVTPQYRSSLPFRWRPGVKLLSQAAMPVALAQCSGDRNGERFRPPG